MVIARSLKDAARLGSATTSLLLRKSEDLVCRNMMCAKLGDACVCRLAVHVSRLGGLRQLDIAENELGALPESVFELPGLAGLDISGVYQSFCKESGSATTAVGVSSELWATACSGVGI